MSDLDDVVEKIIMHKANKMKKGLAPGEKYNEYITNVFEEHGIIASEETVKVFVMGAVDAMIYDVGSALGFTRRTRLVDDWTSWRKRKEMLRKIFPKGI